MTSVVKRNEPSLLPKTSIKGDSVLPKYYQLKHILHELISSLQPGAPVPSEAELCRAYDVSRTTVRKALSELAQEGLVYSLQGKGTFKSDKKKVSSWVTMTGGLYADMTERGFKVSMKMLDMALIPAEENIARELKITEGDMVYKLLRLRFVDDKPFDMVTNFMPAARFPHLDQEDFDHTSLYFILKNKYGVHITSGVRLIEADSCTSEEAHYLEIEPKSPLLVMRSTTFDEHELAIEHGIVRQRSDLAQIVINIIPH
jgi:GntR family transcriptional regulator